MIGFTPRNVLVTKTAPHCKARRGTFWGTGDGETKKRGPRELLENKMGVSPNWGLLEGRHSVYGQVWNPYLCMSLWSRENTGMHSGGWGDRVGHRV